MRRARREPHLRSGALLLTHNQLAFLHGLLDRPRGVARSRRDLVAAATPYVVRLRARGVGLRAGFSYSCVYKAVRNLPAIWCHRKRAGNRIEFRILPTGRANIRRAGARPCAGCWALGAAVNRDLVLAEREAPAKNPLSRTRTTLILRPPREPLLGLRPKASRLVGSELRHAFAQIRVTTTLYRRYMASVFQPQSCIATLRDTPARLGSSPRHAASRAELASHSRALPRPETLGRRTDLTTIRSGKTHGIPRPASAVARQRAPAAPQ